MKKERNRQMKIGDICIVRETGRNIQHPVGTRVKVKIIAGYSKPYYCESEEGKTAYWYKEEDLEVVEREGLI